MTKEKRERKERAQAADQAKRATDRARREREAFAKKIEAARKAAKTTPATGIVDDDVESPTGREGRRDDR